MLVDLADVTGLSAAVSEALAPLRQRDSGHSPGRVAVDLAVMLAEGGEAIADLTVLRNQPALFGSVASDATAWRVLNGIDAAALARIRVARARARELSWMQAAETGRLLSSTVGGFAIPGFVLDIDATIVLCHSEKEQAAKTWKKTWGYHPLLCFLDATGEALSGLLRAGNAGSNTAADHITVLDQALAQIPDAHRHGSDVLIRCDSAGASHAFLRHIRGLRGQGVRTFFSVGVAITEPIRTAITACVDWISALDADRELRDGAEIAELTHLVDLSAYPQGTRMIVRRERPHPGAQLSVFDTVEVMRHRVFITDSPRPTCSLQLLELRHRAHARGGPDPHRQGQRVRPVPVTPVRHQRRVARTRVGRHRPARLDPCAATRQHTCPGRTKEAALPAPARRGPHRPNRPTRLPPHRPGPGPTNWPRPTPALSPCWHTDRPVEHLPQQPSTRDTGASRTTGPAHQPASATIPQTSRIVDQLPSGDRSTARPELGDRRCT
jgi:hypothetical protein